MRTYKILLFVTLLFIGIASCKKDENDTESLKISHWIYSIMKQYYLWNNTISDSKAPNSETEPIEYFKSLLNIPTDKWSFIVDDYPGFSQSMSGNPTSMGYESVYGKFSNSGNVYALVKYVYPDSPADVAGLKRGDFILKINNTVLTEENFQALFTLDTYTLTLGKYIDNSVVETGSKISMTVASIDINPAISEKVFTINNKKIGYLAITEFINAENFIKRVTPSILNLKSQNINELIIDLRYNTGGDVKSAIWLGSVLAPINNTQNKDVFVKLVFNKDLQAHMEQENQTQFTFEYLPDLNLNIDNIYFLTTNFSTASASELVICGLEPYMNVVQIGENTIGKYLGMWVIPHEEKVWAILPVTFKYTNVLDFSDFDDGLVPDYFINDPLDKGYAFSDENDPLIAKAIEVITGLPARKHAEREMDMNYFMSEKQKLKMNLFINQR